ncbi:hybrid sensor histidine kinase/response regulator [Azohydromonas sediminis]|uniref:ATP-binding response regulator n=1 Tax=Azohydromonas sediminis TaxID=2259674 RepID=UPI001F3C01CA|nr:hybrid sensor histidine kinase/response regulator [Azohydromonas sediminis]
MSAVVSTEVPASPTGAPAPAASPTSASAIAAEAVRAHLRQSPVALFGNLVGMVLVGLIFAPVAERWRLAVWFVPVVVLWLLRLAHWLLYGRRADMSDETIVAQRTPLAWLSVAQGAMWGVASWVFWGEGGVFQKTALILMVVTYTFGAVQVVGTQRRLFLVFVGVVFVPGIVRVALDTATPNHLELAGLMLLLFAATLLMARTYRGALADAIALRRHSEQLAAQLQVEKAQAEAARREAEAASRAKTQFFAAASHDLRQPLHAMGLFAEALRQRAHDPEVAKLVNSINESVDALEGLFGELLDITRIDTGGVDVNPQPVRLRELFARLRLHFEPAAFEKGLALHFRGEQHVAHADPVLLERVLRNLVSNAIRYTEDGGVLVSARRRGGKLLLQVWDSGIGIAPASLPRIFDEFYQVNSHRPLEPHHRKGLGLGLAIVKRLAALMDTPLSVRSRPGHGTVFTLEVPEGRAPRALDAQMPKATTPIGLTLDGRLFVVVEDEAAVRDGLVVLLQAWGARVVAFDTVDAVRAWCAGPAAERPDVLLVDYRLPGGTTGLEALALLRARFAGAPLPAIVITGSSLGGHEDEAATHDFHLLIKPVLPNKLRAMIAFKLGVRSGAAG